MVAALIALALPTTNPPRPPFRRIATYQVGIVPMTYVVKDDILIVSSGDGMKAVRIPDGRELWELPATRLYGAGHVVAEGSTVFLSTYATDGTHSALLAADAQTGKVRWRLPKTGPDAPIAIAGSDLYSSLNGEYVSRLRLSDRKVLWKYGKGGLRGMPRIDRCVVAGRTVVIHSDESNLILALDRFTGKPMWQETGYISQHPLATTEGAILVPGRQLGARDAQTGRLLWQWPGDTGELSAAWQGLFVIVRNGELIACTPRTGKVLWRARIGPKDVTDRAQYVKGIGDTLFVQGPNSLFGVSREGAVKWRLDPPLAIAQPIWTNGKKLVAYDRTRLLHYLTGAAMALPKSSSDRSQLAARLIASIGKLDNAEIEVIRRLRGDAVVPLIRAYIDVESTRPRSGYSFEAYQRYMVANQLSALLQKTVSRSDADRLLDGIAQAPDPSTARDLLESLLLDVGGETGLPYFIEKLEGTVRAPKPEGQFPMNALAAVVKSSSPRAVRLTNQLLQDSSLQAYVRREIYTNAIQNGDAETRRRLLSMRLSRRDLPSLEDRMDLQNLDRPNDDSPSKRIYVAKVDGQEYALVHSAVLGSRFDIWLVTRQNGRWTRPLFSGVSAEGVSNWERGVKPPTVAGLPGPKLDAKNWVGALVGNGRLAEDADRDGLTDLIETRLGTDPRNPDTDDDGTLDDRDPWPNAPPRKLSEEEEVIAAAFEAYYHFGDTKVPALLSMPEDWRPFEMPGREGPVIWAPAAPGQPKSQLRWAYEQGVALIGFDPLKGKKIIEWSPDRQAAHVLISTYYGGLNGSGIHLRLRKIDGHWYVASMQNGYIS